VGPERIRRKSRPLFVQTRRGGTSEVAICLGKHIYNGGHGNTPWRRSHGLWHTAPPGAAGLAVRHQPLTDDEHLVWRSLMQLTCTLRPALDEDLQRSCGLSATEYSVLMHVSEAPDRQLRISDLAVCTSLSPSRISRVIDQMAAVGLVERRAGPGDGRNTYAALTRTGLATLRRAWPHHIRSVRQRAFDHLTAEETRVLGPALQRIAEAGDASRSSTSGGTTVGKISS
jgi:DNA-binding MarR family transcriptional regulator